ncbi:unnamed protein product, partial [Laminaria digitata]
RDSRSQRSRTNANKRQRAATSSSSSSLVSSRLSSEQQGGRGGDFAYGRGNEDLSPRGNASCSDLVTPALRNEVRRLRAEAAALGREHASLGAQHTSLVLEKARQAGVLRNRVASADGQVGRLNRQLREAHDKLEAQARETEAVRSQVEGQQGLLHNRSHELEQALARLERIGVALAEERSLNAANTASRRNSVTPDDAAGGASNDTGATSGTSNNTAPSDNTNNNSNSNSNSNSGAGSVSVENDSSHHHGHHRHAAPAASHINAAAPSMSVDDNDDDDDDDDDDDGDVVVAEEGGREERDRLISVGTEGGDSRDSEVVE